MVMTEFLITRVLLVILLRELDYSSAFPRARSSVYPEAWHDKQEGYAYGNRRPLQYIQALRQSHRILRPNVHDQVQVNTWQKPQESFRVRSHAQTQNQPSLYHQTQSPWTQEMSPSKYPSKTMRDHPLSKPRSFEFSLKVPSVNVPGQNKETSSTTKGSDLSSGGSDGSVQIYSSFNSPSGSDSTIHPNGAKTAHEVTEPSFQLGFSIPTPKPSISNGGHLANLQRPGIVGFVENSYMEPAKIPKYPPPQSNNDYSDYYSAQIDPMSNDCVKGQSGQTVSSDPTNVHLSLYSSQYERVPGGYNCAGQVKPSGNNYGQHQTWQPAGTQFPFASEQYNYGQFKPFGHRQNVETVPLPGPTHPSSPTVPPSQYELPSFHQVGTTKYYGPGNVVQMGPKYPLSPYPYQYSSGQSGQDALPDHLTAFDPLPNFQGQSNYYQTQMRPPTQYTREQLDVKPKYTQLFIDVEDVTDGGDGQHNYFVAPPRYYDGYPGKWTE